MDGETLKRARERENFSQEEAAERMGVNVSTYQRWESGTVKPQPLNMRRLQEIFNIPAEESASTARSSAKASSQTASNTTLFPVMSFSLRLSALAFDIPCASFEALQALQANIRQKLEEFSVMDGDSISRREALHDLAALPIFMLKLSPFESVLRYPSDLILAECSGAIAACCELSKSDNK